METSERLVGSGLVPALGLTLTTSLHSPSKASESALRMRTGQALALSQREREEPVACSPESEA